MSGIFYIIWKVAIFLYYVTFNNYSKRCVGVIKFTICRFRNISRNVWDFTSDACVWFLGYCKRHIRGSIQAKPGYGVGVTAVTPLLWCWLLTGNRCSNAVYQSHLWPPGFIMVILYLVARNKYLTYLSPQYRHMFQENIEFSFTDFTEIYGKRAKRMISYKSY